MVTNCRGKGMPDLKTSLTNCKEKDRIAQWWEEYVVYEDSSIEKCTSLIQNN